MRFIHWRIQRLSKLFTGPDSSIVRIGERHSIDWNSSRGLLVFCVGTSFQPSSWDVVSDFQFVVMLTWFSNKVFLHVRIRSQFCPDLRINQLSQMVSLFNKGYEFFSFIRWDVWPLLIFWNIPVYYFLYGSVIL